MQRRGSLIGFQVDIGRWVQFHQLIQDSNVANRTGYVDGSPPAGVNQFIQIGVLGQILED